MMKMTSEIVIVTKKEVTVEDIVKMLRNGAEIEREQIITGWDQELGEPMTKEVGVIKFRENGAETTITLNMSEMVEIVKRLVK